MADRARWQRRHVALDAEAAVAIVRSAHDVELDMHEHDFHELVLVAAGSGEHVTKHDRWRVARGDVFVLTPGYRHGYRDVQGLRIVNICYDPERLPVDWADLARLPGFHALFRLEPASRRRQHFAGRLHLAPQQLARALELADEIEAEQDRHEAGYAFVLAALFQRLVALLARAYQRRSAPAVRELARLGAALARMERDPAADWRVEELAGIAQMSPRHFHRLFAEATGGTPLRHLQQLRIEAAQRLLRESERSVTDIALDCGFGDSNYFARRFRAVCGTTPTRYRARHR